MPDVELDKINVASFSRLEGCEFLICDTFHLSKDKALQGSLGHSSELEAVEFAAKLKAKNLALFHYSPFYDDQTIHQLLKNAQEHAKKFSLKICFSSDELVVTI